MNRVIEVAAGDVIEVRLRAPGAERDSNDAGGDAPTTPPGALPRLQVDALLGPAPGLRIAATTVDDVQGLMMAREPTHPSKGAPQGGTGAPIGLLFEFAGDPAGTFLKYYSKSY